ncbi:hypothetical protein MHK12_05795 [Corynebacterium kefirresidentii]|uniref:FtsK/SpoIIIE domain-containing protein n=1 Tax=Corynebacterium TaxID=1716 RepID=UPI001EF1B9E5|nr:FtsK/SpoIIIE domain-containing protein [Corynebacterium kefirresidentii]MCG7450107.1 hypothetical protein [Corynebacterium kefirresidentii]MCG7452270.1 hypothetical protein [Corynebacterium kefirresidentii]
MIRKNKHARRHTTPPSTPRPQPRRLHSEAPVVAQIWDGGKFHWDTPGAHTVISGATRSGKSVFTYCVLSQLAGMKTVCICGVDVSGITLQPFSQANKDYVACGSSQTDLDAALEVLHRLEALMDHRIEQLRHHKLDKVTLSAQCPAYVVVLEEYAGALAAMEGRNKKDKAEVIRIVGRLLREGAKAGVVVYTVIQRPEANVLHDRAQYARRVTHRLDNHDSVKMVAGEVDEDTETQVLKLAPGRCLVLDAGRDPVFVTTPHLSYQEFITRVEQKLKGAQK